jgi:hypothetical protein
LIGTVWTGGNSSNVNNFAVKSEFYFSADDDVGSGTAIRVFDVPGNGVGVSGIYLLINSFSCRPIDYPRRRIY